MINNLVSVIIPCYNREETIETAVRSVLDQTYKDLEVIIVDDASRDSSVKRINLIQDDRITVYQLNDNHGACFARNYGVSKARGEYIAFQDSDDVWKIDKIEKQLQFLKQNELDFVTSSFERHEDNKSQIFGFCQCPQDKDAVFQKLLDHNWVSTQTILCYKKCFDKISFDPDVRRFQDWDLALQTSEFFKIGSLNENLVDVYLQDNSITKNNDADEAKLKILEKYRGRAWKDSKDLKAQYLKSMADIKRKYKNIEPSYLYFKSFMLKPSSKTAIWSLLSLFGFGKIYKVRQ